MDLAGLFNRACEKLYDKCLETENQMRNMLKKKSDSEIKNYMLVEIIIQIWGQ